MRAQLRKVIDNVNTPIRKQHDRNIAGTIYRAKQRPGDDARRLTRHYTSCDNAIAFLTKFMTTNGYVGDVCEISNNVTGQWIGTIKMTSKGQLRTSFVWDRDE